MPDTRDILTPWLDTSTDAVELAGIASRVVGGLSGAGNHEALFRTWLGWVGIDLYGLK
jgi:hypothetical protein